MNKLRAKTLWLLVGVAAVLCLLAGGYRLMTEQRESPIDLAGLAKPGQPVRSPSGRFWLEPREVTVEGMPHWSVTISRDAGTDRKPVPVFTSPEAFRTRDTLFFLWDSDDRVWVYSGDVGTSYWERLTDDDWQKHTHADDKSVPVPPLLKQLRPRLFP